MEKINDVLINYVKVNISNSRENLYTKIKANKNFNKGNILIKLENSLKAESNSLESDTLTKEQLLEKADTLMNLAQVIENWDELQPTIKEFFKEKQQKKKYDNSKEIELIEE